MLLQADSTFTNVLELIRQGLQAEIATLAIFATLGVLLILGIFVWAFTRQQGSQTKLIEASTNQSTALVEQNKLYDRQLKQYEQNTKNTERLIEIGTRQTDHLVQQTALLQQIAQQNTRVLETLDDTRIFLDQRGNMRMRQGVGAVKKFVASTADAVKAEMKEETAAAMENLTKELTAIKDEVVSNRSEGKQSNQKMTELAARLDDVIKKLDALTPHPDPTPTPVKVIHEGVSS